MPCIGSFNKKHRLTLEDIETHTVTRDEVQYLATRSKLVSCILSLLTFNRYCHKFDDYHIDNCVELIYFKSLFLH